MFWVLFCRITCKRALFFYHRFIFLLPCIDRWKVYIWLALRAQSRLREKLNVNVFKLAKHSTLVGLLRFSPSFLFVWAANNQANSAFKTTIIEDTHLTLIDIPFKVEANNSLIFLPLQTYEKKFAEFSFLFIFTIPCVEWCVIS